MRRGILGDVEFDIVNEESVTNRADITDYTVEDGANLVDHHAVLPVTVTISGLFARKGSDKSISKLVQHQRNADLLKYTGRNVFWNMAIVSISRNHTGDNKYGFAYDIVIQQVPTQSAQRVNVQVVHPKTKKVNKKTTKKTKKKANKGRQQPVKAPKKLNKKKKKKAVKKDIKTVPKRPSRDERVKQYVKNRSKQNK